MAEKMTQQAEKGDQTDTRIADQQALFGKMGKGADLKQKLSWLLGMNNPQYIQMR